MPVSPSRMLCDAEITACNPDPHRRFTVTAGACETRLLVGHARQIHVLQLCVNDVAENDMPQKPMQFESTIGRVLRKVKASE